MRSVYGENLLHLNTERTRELQTKKKESNYLLTVSFLDGSFTFSTFTKT